MPKTFVSYRNDQAFFLNLSIGTGIFCVFAFTQWGLRGYVNYATTPLSVYLHALAMASWLALFIWQNYLALHGDLVRHRKWGRAAVGLAAFLIALGTYVTLQAITLHRVPPIFTPSYFLVLGPVHLAFFAFVLTAAIAGRAHPEWHRRLMLVAQCC